MATQNVLPIGKSILVPNVQELVKQPLVAPPARYIRPDQDSPTISNPVSSVTGPVIDLQKLLCGEDMESEMGRLHAACKEWGFFQLVNHGMDALVESVKHETEKLFKLPIEEKKAFWQKENEFEGFGQAVVMSDEQTLDWRDVFFMTTLPKDARKPHLFPKLPLPLRDSLEAYSSELKILATAVIEMMEKNLNVKGKEVAEAFENATQLIGMNYYPPCPEPEKVIGIPPHSDAGGLTILLQVTDVEGLQLCKQGVWIPIKPLPNAFLANVGDSLEILTNGNYRSTEHRVTVNKYKERISLGTFYNPRFDVEMGPAKSLVTPDTPALYTSIKVGDYYRTRNSRQISGRSSIERMMIQNEQVNPL